MGIQVFFVIVTLFATISSDTEKLHRILDGKETDINKYPFVVQVLRDGSQICGGSLISNRTVLTAAHCVYYNDRAVEINRFQIRLGTSKRNIGGTVYNVLETVVHEDFNMSTIDNDLVVMVLTETVIMGKGVSEASLPPQGYKIPDNSPVFQVGWGYTDVTNKISSSILMEVEVRSVNHNECQKRYKDIRTVTDNMMCTGLLDVGGKDSCGGDSGGPVIHNGFVIGVISWGKSCGLPQYPAVNVDVIKYLTWIKEETEEYETEELSFGFSMIVLIVVFFIIRSWVEDLQARVNIKRL